MKTIIISIHKRWNDLIFVELIKKTEVRKTSPKPPFKAIVYEPFNGGGSGKVIGEFVCNEVDTIINLGNAFEIKDKDKAYTNTVARNSCLDFYDLQKYLKNKNGCAIHITDIILYDKPKELGEFYKPCIMPEMPYCPACKYGNVQYSPDEVECASDLEGASCEWLCLNSVKRPPQSYMRIQDPKEM